MCVSSAEKGRKFCIRCPCIDTSVRKTCVGNSATFPENSLIKREIVTVVRALHLDSAGKFVSELIETATNSSWRITITMYIVVTDIFLDENINFLTLYTHCLLNLFHRDKRNLIK